MFVGVGGDGTLNVTDGAELHSAFDLDIDDFSGAQTAVFNLDGGSVFLGDDFSNDGAFNFSDGLLQVRGDFAPNSAAADFTIDGDDSSDLPTLELIGTGLTQNIAGLTVGDNHRGKLLIRQGRNVSLASNVGIGARAGGEGTIVVESGGTLTTTATLDVGGNGVSPGGAGALQINAGGAIDATTLRVRPAGLVNLHGGTLTVDTLLFNVGGQFDWTTGVLRFDGGNTTLTRPTGLELISSFQTSEPSSFHHSDVSHW